VRNPLRRRAPRSAGAQFPGLEPVSANFGFERGKPIDRWYIERFLDRHSADVRGRVLELYEDTYTRWFGGDRVTGSEVLHKGTDNPAATIDGDLVTGEGLDDGAFDCFIFTQTLHYLSDPRPAVATSRRVLRDGGVCLATIPGISPAMTAEDLELYGDWWRFTSQSARLLFEDVYGAGNVEVAANGNVLSAAAFLYGFAAEELSERELATDDPRYELIVTVRAVRRG
jgi:SAM-dependent methyltransferase